MAITIASSASAQWDTVKLIVEGTPVGAAVELDGAFQGDLPWEGEVGAGSHALRVSMEGYEPHRKTLSVTASERLKKYRVNLRPKAGGTTSTAHVSSGDADSGSLVRLLAGAGLVIVGGGMLAVGAVYAGREDTCEISDAAGVCQRGAKVESGLATGFLVSGIVLAVGGLGLLTWELIESTGNDDSKRYARLELGPGVAKISGRF